MSTFKYFNGQASNFLDCRILKREFEVLENNMCFNLNFWVWLIVIFMAITFFILIILIWTSCCAICEAEGQYGGLTVMQPKENLVNINEQEMIPTI